MDKRTFEKILKDPSDISSEEAIMLEELVQEFPYCQMAHLLIANESYQKKSMHYPKKLRKASTYILDRTVLHTLLNPKKTNVEILVDNTSHIIETEVVEEISHINLANLKNIELLTELESNIQELKRNKDSFSEPFKIVSINTKSDKRPFYLPKTILFDQKPESRFGEELTSETVNLDLLLKYLESANQKAQDVNEQVIIIDKFINSQPKIGQRASSGLLEPENEDLSIPSTELKLELITENFAQILTKQNKIEKAIEVYKKLLLKYPDKSAYFAAKLNELESR